MAKTDAERKRYERERKKERDQLLGMANMTLRMSQAERKLVARRAVANGYEDQTEYLLDLVYAESGVRETQFTKNVTSHEKEETHESA
ncbi:hypothetical protein [uncultured Marinobacter sp.]|uniref:hypothetical protein n=1 Tax=uncultured Marinobacter sp. TaxID=187379 RepID=UPI0025883C32|nr:hypothetical protein [uncultured Marinobacter sp.]